MTVVSIVVPCFNAESFIADALLSVQNQTIADWECLVVDDHSTDATVQILRDYARRDPRFKPILLPVNGGASRARNAALERASGDWVTLLDADDLYAPDRLERLVAIARSEQADLVFDNQIITEFPDDHPVDRAFHWIEDEIMCYSMERFFLDSAEFGRSLNPGYMKPLFARSFLDAHQLRYDPAFRSGQDYLFYANAFASVPKCCATSYAGYIYRRRKGSLSRSGGQHLRGHARLSDEILKRHGASLSPPVRDALKRRKRYFLDAAAVHDLRVAFANRAWGGAARLILSEPRLVSGLAASVQRRMNTRQSGPN